MTLDSDMVEFSDRSLAKLGRDVSMFSAVIEKVHEQVSSFGYRAVMFMVCCPMNVDVVELHVTVSRVPNYDAQMALWDRIDELLFEELNSTWRSRTSLRVFATQ